MKMTAFAQAKTSQKSAGNRSVTGQARGGPLPVQHSTPQRAQQQPCLAHRALRRFLLDMVALVYEVDRAALVASTRGRQKIAFARQVAMYLAHTTGGLSLTEVGGLFGRDRTTVAHGCALVEDTRDDAVFDRSLSLLESAIACQMEMFRTIGQANAPLCAGPHTGYKA